MRSMQESRRLVEEGLDKEAAEIDHDAILANLQDEIDAHNEVKDELLKTVRARRPPPKDDFSSGEGPLSMRFKFKGKPKESTDHSAKRKHRSRYDREGRHKSRKHMYPTPPEEIDLAAHPFPREPVDPLKPTVNSDAAFRESLFDALADDEAAEYWESVYSQPIHVYTRPSVVTQQGELEQMNDDEYAAYVQTKMWERKNPEVVQQREKKERERRFEEEERTRKRAEFVRRKERAAWERAQSWKGGDDGHDDEGERCGRNGRYEYEFAGNANTTSSRREREAEYAAAWSKYLADWDKLKRELLAEHDASSHPQRADVKPSQRLPWPVLASQPVVRANIEAFMRNAPSGEEHPVLKIWKVERVRWHPDKVQQRFTGRVDEGTMKVVVGVFQVVDGLVEEERKRNGTGR